MPTNNFSEVCENCGFRLGHNHYSSNSCPDSNGNFNPDSKTKFKGTGIYHEEDCEYCGSENLRYNPTAKDFFCKDCGEWQKIQMNNSKGFKLGLSEKLTIIHIYKILKKTDPVKWYDNVTFPYIIRTSDGWYVSPNHLISDSSYRFDKIYPLEDIDDIKFTHLDEIFSCCNDSGSSAFLLEQIHHTITFSTESGEKAESKTTRVSHEGKTYEAHVIPMEDGSNMATFYVDGEEIHKPLTNEEYNEKQIRNKN